LAMRAARAFTGKDVICAFTGSFHGMHDYGLVRSDAGAKGSERLGVPQAIDQVMTVLPYAHEVTLDQIYRRRHDLAAVIVEPVRGADPDNRHAEWLHQLASMCWDSNVLLILDEVLTGFRLAYGGAQEMFGLVPDLVTYGNVIGGGLSLGALAGRADIMNAFSNSSNSQSHFTGGTTPSNPLSISAGVATLKHLWDQRTSIYQDLNALGDELAQEFNAYTSSARRPVELRNVGSMFRVMFNSTLSNSRKQPDEAKSAAEAAFYVLALSKGVFLHPGQRGFLSAAHTRQNTQEAARVLIESISDVRDDGLILPSTRH
jgi:glutamate-1-semialdehyde aminotransferase